MSKIEFKENAFYNVEQVAQIINRSPKTVRAMCRRGDIPAKCDRGGYLITGWSLRAYAENRLPVAENNEK